MNIEEQLEELRPLLGLIAWERTGTQYWLYDDAEQEAMIAAWTRLSEGHSPGIAVYKAKQAVIDLVRGRRTTGSKSHGGHVDSHTKSESIFRESEDGGYVFEPVDDKAQRDLDQILLRADLRAALSGLEDEEREILHGIHWEGLTQRELGDRYGITPQAVSLRLKKTYAKLRPVVA